MQPILITGMGVVSAVGIGTDALLTALQQGVSGVHAPRFLKTKHTQYPVGEVPYGNEELREKCGATFLPQGDVARATLIGLLAAREAIEHAELSKDDLAKAAFVSGTCVGGMDVTEKHLSQLLQSDSFNDLLRQHPCGEHTNQIARSLGIGGYQTTISTACSSALNAILEGALLIQNQQAEIVIVGSSEALTNYHFNGFRTLHILSEQTCRPFDADRNGINLGEGAGYLVLESAASALKRHKTPIAYLVGMGNTCDAFHQTASSDNGEGAYLAMKEALRTAQLLPKQINYLNAHGTATPNNDASESEAIRRVFETALPPVSSTKAFTGHTTAASGAIESVICLLALQHHFIPRNLNWQTPMQTGIVPYVNTDKAARLQYVMCNAFGFGGNDTSVIFGKETNTSALSFRQKDETHIYIHRPAYIGAQSPLSSDWMQNVVSADRSVLHTLDPDFSPFVSAGQARRLGPLLKRAMATSLHSLRNGEEIVRPDAIIAGTGLGCIANTENFLKQIKNNNEELLTPTPFMQSTHNTISSQLAIQLQSHAYNATYSHLDNSFFSAMIDAVAHMLSPQYEWQNMLIGGYDELTEDVLNLLRKSLFYGHSDSVMASEAAVSMLLSTTPSACELTDIMHPTSHPNAYKLLDDLLQKDDLILLGVNGDKENDKRYHQIIDCYYDHTFLHYKHLFGENMSSDAVGLYVAAECMLQQTVPTSLLYKGSLPKKLNGIVFVHISYTDTIAALRVQ